MTGRSGRGRVAEYLAVLRGFGLAESAIAAAHDAAGRSGDELVEHLASELGDADDSALHASLREALATSPRGVDAPLEYWNHAPEVHLEALLAPYGCSVRVEPARDADALADGTLAIRLTDADGRTYWTRFAYPDSDLGTDNYPALLHHVERTLLDGTGLRFVRLAAPSGRWWFAMVTEAQLGALRDRYGERVEVFGSPLLAADQLSAFDTQVPPIPPGYEPTLDDVDASGPSLEPVSADSLEELREDVESGGIDLDDGPDPSAESVVQSVRQAGAGSGSTAAVSGGDAVEATDAEVESVLGDLSDVDLEPEPQRDAETEEPAALDGSADEHAPADDVDPLEGCFEELRREIAGTEPTTGEEADAGRETSVSDLLEGAAGDDAASRDPDPPGDAEDDVPRDAADLTASELFRTLREE